MINESLRRCDGTPIEGGDPAREPIDEAVQFRVRKCAVDVSVSLCGIAVEVVAAENDFECAAAADQQWETFRTAAAGCTDPDFWLAQELPAATRGVCRTCRALVTPWTQPPRIFTLATGDLVETNERISSG